MKLMLRLVETVFLSSFVLGDDVEYHAATCSGLEDGVHWVRPLLGKITSDFDDYPSIQVRCSNGYMIFDYSLDPNIASYFSSFWIWTDDAASSSLTDRVTWTDWFLPNSNSNKNQNKKSSDSDNTMSFQLSEDCNTCETSDEYGDFAAYFMTGNYIGMCMSFSFYLVF